MKFKLLIGLGLFMICQVCTAQISVYEDDLISLMIERHKQENRSVGTVTGYRLQLTASTDRMKVLDMKEKFLSIFPDLSAEWVYKAPFYKLNVGAFRTKLEATALKHKLRLDFPDSYVARDTNIRPSEFD